MPISASLAEPSGGSTARNSTTQTFLSDGFVTRMPFTDASAETDDSSPSSPLSAVHHNDLAARMRLLIRREGSMASIARRCGFSEGAVRSWRDGQSDISRERCVIMARTLNISLIWLITGDGPMRPEPIAEESAPRPTNQPSPPPAKHAVRHQDNDNARAAHPAVDSRVLAAALRLLQSYIGLLGGSLNPVQRADVLAELYDILRSADEPGYIDRLIAFHSMLSGQMRHGSSLVA